MTCYTLGSSWNLNGLESLLLGLNLMISVFIVINAEVIQNRVCVCVEQFINLHHHQVELSVVQSKREN